MREFNFALLFLLFSTSIFCQDSLWKQKIVNPVLSLQLPAKLFTQEASFVRAFGGEVYSNYYALQYYDTTFLPVNNEQDFQISLTGFMSGRVGDSVLKRYNVLVVDTTISGVKGLFATFTTEAVSETYKQIYYFVTLANNQYYWFQVYLPNLDQSNTEVHHFFKSIKFNTSILKESAFRLTPVHLVKKAE